MEWTVRPGGYGRLARWANRALWVVDRPVIPEHLLRGVDAPELDEPLRRICADLAEHPPTALGRAMIRATLTQGLVSRSRLQRVDAPPMRRPPIVLVGWYRTGTTYLQQLLDALPGYGFVPLHRLMDPVGGRTSRLRARVGTRLAQALSPALRTVHPVTADGPEECWMLLLTHLLVDGMAFHWTLPRYERWLADVDRLPAYRAWAHAAGWLEAELGHGLVLKDPAHLLALDAIAQVAPDARVVWTHRDPVDCIASYGSVTAIQHRAVYGRYAPYRAGRVCLDRMTTYTRAGLAHREGLRIADVRFDDLQADPVGTVARICAELELPYDEHAVTNRVSELSAGRRPHRTDLSQWGLDEERVRAALPHYEARWWGDRS